MIKFTTKVTLEDGTAFPPVKVMPGDIVRFERRFGVPISAIGTAALFEHYLFLGWSPLNRKGLTGLDFDEFCEQVEDVDLSTGDEAVPTPPVLSEDDSSS